jgi:hypothetical protein
MHRPRILGYGGLPLLESIPCFCLAMFALCRISRMHQIHERLSRDVAFGYTFDVTTFSVRPSTASKYEGDDALRPNPSPHFSASSSPHAMSSPRPSLTNPGPTANLTTTFLLPTAHSRDESSPQFYLPSKSDEGSASHGSSLFAPYPQDIHIRVDSLTSSTLPTSTPLNHTDNNYNSRHLSPYISSGDEEVASDAPHEDTQCSFISSVVFNRNPSPKTELDHELGIRDQAHHRRDEDPRYAG